jgi:hypothetical protein
MLFVLGDEARPILQQLANDRDERIARIARSGLEELDRRQTPKP